MIVSISDPKNSTTEFLELTNSFSKVDGYKINSNKSEALYMDDKWAEKESLRTALFMIFTNIIKYLGITLTKEGEDFYDNNLKYLKNQSTLQIIERSPMLTDK